MTIRLVYLVVGFTAQSIVTSIQMPREIAIWSTVMFTFGIGMGMWAERQCRELERKNL